MSNPAKPAWPDPAAFSLFGNATTPAAPPAFGQPFAQGLAGGVDFIKKLWGNVPGNTAVPGFLLPTLDVDELDKRISDLKAAESWLEVNLNLLRATVQGLEVQRHTIAAIRSLGAVTETPQAPRAASSAPLTPSGLPPGWPVAHASQDPSNAQSDADRTDADSAPGAGIAAASVAPAQSDPTAPEVEAVPPDADADADVDEADERRVAAAKKSARKPARKSTGSDASAAAAPMASPASALAGLTANNWLGYMQDQFAKVAQAALASSEIVRPHEGRDAQARTAPAKGLSKDAAKAAAKGVKRAVKRDVKQDVKRAAKGAVKPRTGAAKKRAAR